MEKMLSPRARYTEVLNVKLTKAQENVLDEMAEAYKLTRSELVRMALSQFTSTYHTRPVRSE